MWDKLERIFPEALPALRRQPIPIRILVLVALLALPLAGAIAWAPLTALLRQGTTIEIPVRLFAAALSAGAVALLVAWLAAARLRRRSQLRSFLRQWVELRRRFELLHMKIDGWLARDQGGLDDPRFNDITDDIQDYFARRIPLRRLLFLLGEETLIAKESQHWLELKAKEAIFRERDYLTPFGFILDLGAPIGSINHHGEAIWAALFISDEYVEYLKYKYPFLESAAA